MTMRSLNPCRVLSRIPVAVLALAGLVFVAACASPRSAADLPLRPTVDTSLVVDVQDHVLDGRTVTVAGDIRRKLGADEYVLRDQTGEIRLRTANLSAGAISLGQAYVVRGRFVRERDARYIVVEAATPWDQG